MKSISSTKSSRRRCWNRREENKGENECSCVCVCEALDIYLERKRRREKNARKRMKKKKHLLQQSLFAGKKQKNYYGH
jgi:hypothetical protein